MQKEGLISALQSHLDLAKETLIKLPTDIEIKLDNGFDIDASSGSHEGIYHTLRSPDTPKDRSGIYRVDGTPRSGQSDETNNITGSKCELDHAHREINLKYTKSNSIHSIDSRRSFVAEFTDIRNSVAAEIDNATFINSDLRNSLSVDMERPYSETEWLYEANAAPELAGSIAQSYNLGDSGEMLRYIQTCLPCENNVFQIKRSRRLSSSSVMSISESMSNRSADVDDMSVEDPSLSRDSATPNSQQHAAILRYYSYRHVDDGLKRFKTYRVNREFRPPSFRFSRNTPNNSFNTPDSRNPSVRRNSAAIYSIPNVIQNPPRLFKDVEWPMDSFV